MSTAEPPGHDSAQPPTRDAILEAVSAYVDEHLQEIMAAAAKQGASPADFVVSGLSHEVDRQADILHFDGLTIDIAATNVTLTTGGHTQPVRLTDSEFSLLVFLAKNAGGILSRDTLIREVWLVTRDSSTSVVDVAVMRLRQKLHDNQSPHRFIETVRGRGYRFVATTL